MKTFRYFLLVLFLCSGLLIWNWCTLFSQTLCQKDFKDFSEISLEELLDVTVTSASKHEQEISQAPAFVTVITDEMIEAFNYHSVADALRSVPGMWITSDRYLFQLGIRGVAVDGDWNSRILLLLNGHTLNEQWCGTANSDELLGIDMRNVKRIEVVKGPGFSLYGSNAFFGVINVVTKDAESAKGPRLVTGFTDQVNRTDGNFSFGRKFSDDFKVLFSGSVSDSRGGRLFFPVYRDLEESERLALEENGYSQYFLSLDKLTGGYTSKTDFLKSHSLFLNLHYKDFSLLSKVSNRDKGVPSGYYGSVFNTDKNKGGRKVQDTIHIGVLYFSDDERSKKNKDAIIENFKLNKDKTINGVPFSFMEIGFSTEKSLDEVTTEKRVNILYITTDGSTISKGIS